jgi:hypothetical protein
MLYSSAAYASVYAPSSVQPHLEAFSTWKWSKRLLVALMVEGCVEDEEERVVSARVVWPGSAARRRNSSLVDASIGLHEVNDAARAIRACVCMYYACLCVLPSPQLRRS